MENEIRKELMNFLRIRLEGEKEIENSGDYRAYSGNTVEKLVDLLFDKLKELYPSLNIECLVGRKSPISIQSGKYHIEESVDRHIFINGKLVLAVECKTYLDKCFLQRADSDFSLMKSGKKGWKGIVLALEDNIDENSKNFFMSRKNVDETFILYTGKRKSNVLLADTYKERENEKLIDEFVSYAINLCEKKGSRK